MRRIYSTRFGLAGCSAVVLAFLVGCGGDSARPSPGEAPAPLVAATIFPLADIAATIGGQAVEVLTIVPAGADPHAFDPTPDLVRRLERAGLVLAIGAHLDDWVVGLARGAGAPLLTLTSGIALSAGDPHIWLDPVLVRDEVLPKITRALVQLSPDAEAEITHRAELYRDSLTALDAEIRQMLADVVSPFFVAAHDAWGYFASRYALEQVGVIYRGHGSEPGPRELADLVERARRAGVRAVFTEPQLGETAARALATELGAEVGLLDPLGGAGVEARDSYLAMLRANANEFARVLAVRRD